MKKAIWAALAFIFAAASFCYGAPLRFEKLSEHCYCLQLNENENVAAVVTDEGILIINPPSESELPDMLEALKRLSAKLVRWVAFTDIRFSRNAGAKYFAEHGAVLIASVQFQALLMRSVGTEEIRTSFPWYYFSRQMHLFPAELEIRIIAVQSKARSGGDVVVFVPAEKVLFAGAMHEFARYPEIDMEADGDALGWIEGMKQVVASVPLLKAAIPPRSPAKSQPKTDSKPEQEKTLEEGIIVVPARGGVSNLQNVKDILEAAQRLQNELSRIVKSGRTCENFLASIGADRYRNFGNLDGYIEQLCNSLNSRADSERRGNQPSPWR